MKRKNVLTALSLTSLSLMLSLNACESQPQKPQPIQPPLVVKPASAPPLPDSAKQPDLPALCSPTCLGGLTKLRESWLPLLTPHTPPASSASPTTTASSPK